MTDKYLKAERRLAELLGYKEIFRLRVDGIEHGGLQYNKSTYTGADQVPRLECLRPVDGRVPLFS